MSNALMRHPRGVVPGGGQKESARELAHSKTLRARNLPRIALSEVRLCAPVERQEVWAAGVTYVRSKTARMEESDFSATAYDKVYAANLGVEVHAAGGLAFNAPGWIVMFESERVFGFGALVSDSICVTVLIFWEWIKLR